MLEALVLVLVVLAGLFVVSGVVPNYLKSKARRERAEEFERQLSAYLTQPTTHQGRRWLLAHSSEMQRDAQWVGKGVVYVGPPPMLGGGRYAAWQMFEDFENRQSFTQGFGHEQRLDELPSIIHELRRVEGVARSRLINPWSWLRLSFERVVALPRYVLTHAGFSESVVNSTGARLVTVLWSMIIGVATIGAFGVALYEQLAKQ